MYLCNLNLDLLDIDIFIKFLGNLSVESVDELIFIVQT